MQIAYSIFQGDWPLSGWQPRLSGYTCRWARRWWARGKRTTPALLV